MADRKPAEFSSNFNAIFAPFTPFILSCSRRACLLEIKEISDKTKKPFSKIRNANMISSIFEIKCGNEDILPQR